MRIVPIKGYEGRYEISDTGKVFSCERDILQPDYKGDYYIYHRKGKEMKPGVNPKSKYLIVILSKNNKRKTFTVHRLVAQHFVPNPNNDPIVMHDDDNPQNDNWYNLIWGTHKQNSKQAYDHGRIKVLGKGEDHPQAIFDNKKVLKVIQMYKSEKYTIAEIARKMKVNYGHISMIVRGESWNHLTHIKDNEKIKKEFKIIRKNILENNRPNGEEIRSSKLTQKDILKIIKMDLSGQYLQREIAEEFNIVQQTVSKIVREKAWKHIKR